MSLTNEGSARFSFITLSTKPKARFRSGSGPVFVAILPNAPQKLKALAESDFIQRYVYYGLPAKEERYRLVDFFTPHALTVLEKQAAPDADVWRGLHDRRVMDAWYAFAFESLCWNHVPQIKKALGIASVQTAEFSWRTESTDEYPG